MFWFLWFSACPDDDFVLKSNCGVGPQRGCVLSIWRWLGHASTNAHRKNNPSAHWTTAFGFACIALDCISISADVDAPCLCSHAPCTCTLDQGITFVVHTKIVFVLALSFAGARNRRYFSQSSLPQGSYRHRHRLLQFSAAISIPHSCNKPLSRRSVVALTDSTTTHALTQTAQNVIGGLVIA